MEVYPSSLLRDTSPFFGKLVEKAAKHAFRDFHIIGPWKGQPDLGGDGFWSVCVTPKRGHTGNCALLFLAIDSRPDGYLDTGIGFHFFGFHPYEVVRGRTTPFGAPKKLITLKELSR